MAPPAAFKRRLGLNVPTQVVGVLCTIGLLVVYLRPRPDHSGLVAHSASQQQEPVQAARAPGTIAITTDAFVALVNDPELQITSILKASLQAAPQHGALMLDIGMNAGRFTLQSAKLGAAVIAIEPQPACVDIVSQQLSSKELANLQSQVTILNAAVGSSAGVIEVPLTGCDPSFGVGGVAKPAAAAAARQAVAVLPLSAFLRSFHQVVVAKVDVEGAEVQVLQQLLPLAQAGRLEALVVELMPGNWAARGADVEQGVKVLQDLAAASKQTVLLTDPTPFKMQKQNVTADKVPGPLYAGFDMQQLVQDRLGHDAPNEPLPHGCNVWFRFK